MSKTENNNNSNATVTDAFAFTPAKGESTQAFQAFRLYLDLGPRRRLATVARQIGVTPRTVRRWVSDFDWHGRVRQHLATAARNEAALQHEELVNVAEHSRSVRERQILLAESVLDLAERCLDRIADEDCDRLRLSDVCRALALSSQFLESARQADKTPDTSLRDQLTSLLNQVYAEPKSAAAQHPVAPPQPVTRN